MNTVFCLRCRCSMFMEEQAVLEKSVQIATELATTAQM